MNIVTRGMGDKQRLVTRGYGSYVAIVVETYKDTAGGIVAPSEDISHLLLDKSIIKTDRIKLPFIKDYINVDVYLIAEEQMKNIDVIVEALGIESYTVIGKAKLIEED
jgi:hypothetical protein